MGNMLTNYIICLHATQVVIDGYYFDKLSPF